jgi:diguanylate cyclase (GGDEF)-like protein/PAS domain S-box-containing protein
MTDISKKEKPLPTNTELILKPSGAFIKHNRDYLAKLTDFLPDIIYIYHLPLQKTLFVNKAFTDTLGYLQKDLLTGEVDWFKIFHPDDVASAPAIAASISKLQDQATIEYELQCKTIKGNYIWLHNKLTIFTRDQTGKPEQVLVTSHDITYRKSLESKLMSRAYTDHLTGLLNRTVFLEKLDWKIQNEAHDFAVLFLDINEFKCINDTYGHEIGDQVILKVAKRLSSLLPEPNIVARLGGDEFTIIINDCRSKKTLTNHVNNIQETLTKKMHINDIELKINASIGSILAKHVTSPSPSKLIKIADQAMYEAKKMFYEKRSKFSKQTELLSNSPQSEEC